MPRLDRLIELRIPDPPGVTGGLTGGVAQFRIVQDRARRGGVSDTYLVAYDASAQPVSAMGTWLAGSVVRWETPLTGQQAAEFNRPVTWASSTLSLATGAAFDSAWQRSAEVRAPYITDPAWWSIVAGYTTAVAADGPILDIGGVLPESTTVKRVWASLVEEQYDETSATVGGLEVPRVLGAATWMMRARRGVVPFSRIVDNGVTWQVVGVRSLDGRLRGAFVEVDATREYYGVG